MSQARKLKACDLFCGAGGTTTGAVMSGHVDVVLAINHWRVAVSSHGLNHPDTRHICAEIDNVNPREFRDMGINLLLASPECVGHSNAKGDAPVDDQRRATAWCVPRWLEMLRPKYAVIENVREFQNWGPLIPKRDKDTGKIVKDKKGRTAMVLDPERKGEIFDAWVAAIRGIGYRVEWRLLNAADFGGATKRIRLFMICRLGKSRAAMPWPKPTHTPEQYTPAAAIIDWGLDCPSIFTRKKPLVDKTIRRIEIGVRKFAAVEPKPFLVDRNWQENRGGRNRVHDIEQPLTTVTGQNAQGLVQPFVVNLHGKSTAQSTDTPTPTVTGNRNLGLAQPFLVPNLGERDGQTPRTHDIDVPLPAVTGHGAGGLVTPFLLPRQGKYDCHKDKPPASVDEPLNTVTAGHSPAALVSPSFVVQTRGPGYGSDQARVNSVEEPLPTVITEHRHALVSPFIAKVAGSGMNDPSFKGVTDVSQPMPTIVGQKHHAVVAPFVVAYHSGDDAKHGADRTSGVDEPLPTVDTNPRFAVAQPFQFQMIGRGAGRTHGVNEPVPTIVAARENHGLVQPYLIDVNHGDDERTGDRVQSVDAPLGTVTTTRGKSLIQPFLTQYYGTGHADSVDEPLATVTTKERHGLAIASYGERLAGLREQFGHSPAMLSLINTMEEFGIADIGYRMLVNNELKRAQGFPEDYLLMGTEAEVTKQIGNSVHTAVANAIARAIGEAETPKPRVKKSTRGRKSA